jgi:hypothetical protein
VVWKLPPYCTSSLKVGQALQLHNGTTVVIKQIDTNVRLEKVYNVANTHNKTGVMKIVNI